MKTTAAGPVVLLVLISLLASACGGDDPPNDRDDVPVINETAGAVNTSELGSAGVSDRGVVIDIGVGRIDPAQERIPSLEGIAKTDSGDHECEGRTHGLGTIWESSGSSMYTFLCPDLPLDSLIAFEVHVRDSSR